MYNQISVKSITLFALCCLIFLSAVPANAQTSSCFAPGNSVILDEQTNVLPIYDIQSVHIAEPYSSDGSQKMIVTLKVQNLLGLMGGATPLGTWNVLMTSGGTTRFVRMTTVVGTPSFEYGTVTNLLGIPVFNVQGSASGTFDQTGRITIPVNKSSFGSPSTGQVYAVEGRTYLNTFRCWIDKYGQHCRCKLYGVG